MGCIYSGVCSPLVAAVMAHCGISPSRYGSLSKVDLFFEFFVGLCNLKGMCVSNMVKHLAGGEEVQLSFHLILWAVWHIAFLLLRTTCPFGGFFSIARLCSESVHSQRVPSFWVSHSGQLFCHCVLSV
jgi:hypothetical protein